jgi:hypothetical protein
VLLVRAHSAHHSPPRLQPHLPANTQAYVQDVARGILPSWRAIAQRRRAEAFTDAQRQWQLLRCVCVVAASAWVVRCTARRGRRRGRSCTALCQPLPTNAPRTRTWKHTLHHTSHVTRHPSHVTRHTSHTGEAATSSSTCCTTGASSLGWTAAAWSPSWCACLCRLAVCVVPLPVAWRASGLARAARDTPASQRLSPPECTAGVCAAADRVALQRGA